MKRSPAQQLADAMKSVRRTNKYGAKKTILDGITFDSTLEARYYASLKRMEQAGQVYGVELQKPYPILMNGIVCGKYRADFSFWDQHEKRQRVVDTKGHDTPLSRFKRKLVEAQYGVKVEVVNAA